MKNYTGISLGTLNLKLPILCAAPLYLSVKWQWSLTFLSFYYWQTFLGIFFDILLFINVILILLLIKVTFFPFQNQLCFLRVLFKDSQNFFIQSSPQYKVCLFSTWSNAQIVDTEYQQRIFSPIFAVEEFSELFEHPSIFFSIKDSIQHR